MKCRWSLKEHNEGASLIAVLTSILFVMTIAAIVLNVTVTNIRMRAVEEAEKRSFYSAEQVMDELSVNLNNAASKAMQEAYTGILTNYSNLIEDGRDLQAEFTRSYMGNLTELFWDQVHETRKDQKIKTRYNSNDEVEELVYVWGYYNQSLVSNQMPEGTEDFFVSSDSEAFFSADYVEGLFTLHNVKIDYVDKQGYAAAISTDMVFHTPVMNFEGSYKVMNYMKFSLISDTQIGIFGSGNVNVNGSVYAGPYGIQVYDSTASFKGGDIVTRGDIEVTSGSNAVFGDTGSRIWVENIVTSGDGEASKLVMDGNIYVADDLSLNGRDSTVELNGNYYGYNFLEKYDGSATSSTMGAQFSSAIVINGQNCHLDMSGLDYLLLAGRTYLSRGNSIHDVVLGESLSVRTNQLAYYIPEQFLDIDENNKDIVSFTATGAVEYSQYAGVSNIMSYLDATTPIAVYLYRLNNGLARRYYLNFADEQKANDFFTRYWSANSDRMNNYGNSFADAIILSDSLLYTLKGDLLTREEGTDFVQQHVEITPELWNSKEDNASTGTEGIYYTYANQLAINYKSLQTYLEDYSKDVNSTNVRFYNGDEIDKSVQPLLDQLIDWSKIHAGNETIYEYTNYEINKTGTDELLIVVTDNADDLPYTIKEGWQKGIIIATGDVNVELDFTGIIIARGKINMSSTANVTVNSDELMVAQMFADDSQSGSPKFAHLFKDYGTLNESVIGVVRIDEYLTYENWSRTDY